MVKSLLLNHRKEVILHREDSGNWTTKKGWPHKPPTDAPLVPTMATAPLLGRAFPHLRLQLNTPLPAAVCLLIRRPCYTTTAAELNRPIKKVPFTTTTYDDKASLLSAKPHPPKDPKWENDPDYRKWKDKEAEIFQDIDPITLLVKDILHSDRFSSISHYSSWHIFTNQTT